MSQQMYIANCTQQVQSFCYRLPESNKPVWREIPIGGQIKIENLSTPDIEAIAVQHAQYGMIRVDDKLHAFSGLCWDVKPINMDKVRSAIQHNQGQLQELGRKIREESAVAINNSLEQQIQRPQDLHNLEVELVEDQKPNASTEVNEVIQVNRNVEPGRQQGGAKRNRR